MAEREGFEPPEPFPVQWFSRPPPSTTRPSLRTAQIILACALVRFVTHPARCRALIRVAADDRAVPHAHLLGHHVLPLRVHGDLDRPVRTQRERRLRLPDARPLEPGPD